MLRSWMREGKAGHEKTEKAGPVLLRRWHSQGSGLAGMLGDNFIHLCMFFFCIHRPPITESSHLIVQGQPAMATLLWWGGNWALGPVHGHTATGLLSLVLLLFLQLASSKLPLAWALHACWLQPLNVWPRPQHTFIPFIYAALQVQWISTCTLWTLCSSRLAVCPEQSLQRAVLSSSALYPLLVDTFPRELVARGGAGRGFHSFLGLLHRALSTISLHRDIFWVQVQCFKFIPDSNLAQLNLISYWWDDNDNLKLNFRKQKGL